MIKYSMFKLILILSLLSSTLLSIETKKVTLQLVWKNQFQFAGFYIAKELGYYNDVGIDVKILEYQDKIDQVALVEDANVDFAIGRSSLLIDKSNGRDIVALGAMFQLSPMMLLVKKDSNINSISDLKNKTVVMTSDVQRDASIIAMLNSKGLKESDMNLISGDFSLTNLINGSVDAITAYTSNEPIVLESKDIEYKIFHPKDYGFYFYSDILFTSSKFIKNNPKLTLDFYKATMKGWEYAFNNIGKTSKIIYEKYNTQNKSFINLVREGEILKELAYDEYGIEFILDKTRLQHIIDIYKILGIMDNNVDLDDFIYEYNADNIYKLKLQHNDIFHFVLIILVLFFLLLGTIFYFSIRKKWLLTKRELQREIKINEKKIKNQNILILQQAKMTAMGDMLENIAHQWRQPLNNISINISNLEISTKLQKTINEEDLFKCIDSTTKQINYLSETIEVFRNFLKSGPTDQTQIELKETIFEAVSLITDSFRHENITIVENIQNATLLLNKSNLTQVLINILNNAKDAMTQRDIDYRYLFINSFIENDKVIINIKDSAGGIDESIIDKVFEPYFSTKTNTKGTGIGLYIVHEIISKNLNGTIEVKNSNFTYNSKKLTGAEFIISLPIFKNP